MSSGEGSLQPRAGGLGADGHVTEELLERLLASSSVEEYLSREQDGLETRGLSGYLADLLAEKGTSRSQVIRDSGLNATFTYQVFQGSRRIGRDRAIMLAFGLGCSLHETQRLLRLSGSSELWSRRRRDAIIIFCVQQGLTRVQCDDELFRMGERTLLSEEG